MKLFSILMKCQITLCAGKGYYEKSLSAARNCYSSLRTWLRKGLTSQKWSYGLGDSLNLESNEKSPSSSAQKLTELWDFKNGILKKLFLTKWLFKILVIFFTIWNCILQQIFVLKQCAFVQEQNVLSNGGKCHIKVQPFFYQNQWKPENQIFWPFPPFQKRLYLAFQDRQSWTFSQTRTQ